MPNAPADFIWYELLTSNPDAAALFYSFVVGWTSEDSGQPQVRYTLLRAGDTAVAGLMGLTPEMLAAGGRPTWLGYIGVPDVDQAVAAVKNMGGTLRQAPPDIPDVGRFAVVGDPQGAAFGLFAPKGDASPPLPEMTSGHIGWHELHTSNWHDAFDFYSRQFGWAKAEAMDMGPMGTYQTFTADGPNWKGAMHNADTFGRPAWLFYFVVGDIDQAVERVRSAGGEVLEGPMEVPGSAWIIQGRDPQGAMFALVGRRG